MDGWKMSFLQGFGLFSGAFAVSFREVNWKVGIDRGTTFLLGRTAFLGWVTNNSLSWSILSYSGILNYFHWLLFQGQKLHFTTLFLDGKEGHNMFLFYQQTTLREPSNMINYHFSFHVSLNFSHPRRIASFAQSHQSPWCGGHCPCCWPVQDDGIFACRRVKFIMGKWRFIQFSYLNM